MNYTKPEVVLNVNASTVIKGSIDKPPLVFQLDANGIDRNATSAAYEADE